MNDSSNEEKNASVLSEDVRQKITRYLKAFLRGQEIDADAFVKAIIDGPNRDWIYKYQVAQTVLEATRALQDFDKLRTRNLTDQQHAILFRILSLGVCSKPMAKFIARSTFLMDCLGIGSFFFHS